MNRKTDIYHRWVAWSEEDQAYIGRCPDLSRNPKLSLCLELF
jgi:hypothetical protein